MRDFRLTTTERNQVFEKAKELEFDPIATFEWGDAKEAGRFLSVLRCKGTGYYFQFGRYSDSSGLIHYDAEWFPAVGGKVAASFRDRKNDQFVAAWYWLQVMRKERDTPDLWALAAREHELISGEATDGDRGFSADERQRLSERLLLLEQEILKLGPATDDQRGLVRESIDAADKAADRLTRRDWKNLFVGTLFRIIGDLALDPTKFHRLAHLASIYIGPFVANIKDLLTS